jgi:hypothetical protein
MNKIMMLTSAALLTFAASGAAMAADGGVAAGATTGAVGGAIVGGIAGDNQPRFREYVVREGRPSYSYREDVRVGAELPTSGVTYYDVPREYGQTEYRYTRVNNRTVLVDPRTHRIVQVID